MFISHLMKKMNYRYLLIIAFNMIIGVCALGVGRWTAGRILRSDVASYSPPQSMRAVLNVLSDRAFAFDQDIATGVLDSAKPGELKESIEQNLQSLLSQYGALPKQRNSFLLERNSNIKGATPEQNKAYRELLVEREAAISLEQKLAITQKIREILGDLGEEYRVSVVGKDN